MMRLRIKVCGMREPENIRVISSYEPDYMGFIFYEKSPRFVGDGYAVSILDSIPETVKKVGVFVNEDINKLKDTIEKYQLELVQLHGDENLNYCEELKNDGKKIIKAISIESADDVDKCRLYKDIADFILFDTKGKNYGGTGRKFNWDLLKSYDLNIPCFLSGGLSIEDMNDLGIFQDLGIHGLDINSGFELEPGIKDLHKVQKAINNIKAEVYE